ncbi:MAG: hypothetical protein ACREYC_17360 [Gammaproteobacteria bacterium]
MKYRCRIFIDEKKHDAIPQSEQAAIRVASRIPSARMGSIEVRPIMELNPR